MQYADSPFTIEPIAFIHTPYKEKFAIPRQPGLAPAAVGRIEFTAAYQHPDYIRGIEQFSHLWLMFQFHQTRHKAVSALVRPPRLGGNKKMGVFATRSTHRPNHMGMSVVKLDSVEHKANVVSLLVSGVDLLDQTPILDIKPYLPYCDNIADAQDGLTQDTPWSNLPVRFLPQAESQLEELCSRLPNLQKLIVQVLAQDPRPAYQAQVESERVYGVCLYDVNVQWTVQQQTCLVQKVTPSK